jgi:hypothetical protein
MSTPAREPEPVPELDAGDALRGVVNQLTINGERMPVIIPGSIIEALRLFAELVTFAQRLGHMPELLLTAMPWARSLSEDDLSEFVSQLVEAAASGDHAPERLSSVMRSWQETADVLSEPGALAEITAARAEIGRGDVISGIEAVRALRPRGDGA